MRFETLCHILCREETQEFIASIQERRAPLVTGIDGKIPILMAMAANQLLQERRPVRIELNKA